MRRYLDPYNNCCNNLVPENFKNPKNSMLFFWGKKEYIFGY